MLPISVCIIAKNEEKNMEEFLTRIKPYDWEIIVLDTGSTDRTKEIALQYADIVSDFVWINDFSAARNRSMELANRDYILVLDCDELLTEIDPEGIIQLIESHPHDAGYIIRKNFFFTNQGELAVGTEYTERIFPKAEYHYELTIHEQLTRNDQTPFKRYIAPIEVEHSGYILSQEETQKKIKRNLDLLKLELSKDKNNPYLLYQIGQCYNMLNDYENSYTYYKKAILSHLDPRLEYMHMLIIAYGNTLLVTNRLEEAEILLKIYDSFAHYADFYCLIGCIYLRKNQPLKAMMEFLKASQAEAYFVEDYKINIPFYQMGLINEYMGNPEAAIMHYKKCQNYIHAEERLKILGQ